MLRIDILAPCVIDEFMHFLYARGLSRWHDDSRIGRTSKILTASSSQYNDFQFLLSRLRYGRKNIFGFPARRKRNKYIANGSKRLHLSFENILEAVIVADSCQCRGVNCEGYCRQAPTLGLVA